MGKNGFRDLCPSLRVFFGAVKLMKFQHSHFTLGTTYDIANLVFKTSQVFAKHGFASVLYMNLEFFMSYRYETGKYELTILAASTLHVKAKSTAS